MSDPSPAISVVVPTVDRARLLGVALTSLSRQAGAPTFETIVVDNGSRESTAEVVRRFEAPTLIWERLKETMPVAISWGRGVQLARGEFLVFLNDDDQLDREFLAHRYDALRNDPNAMVAFSQYSQVDPVGRVLGVINPFAASLKRLGGAELLRAAFAGWFVGASMYRTRIVQAAWPHLPRDLPFVDVALHIRMAIHEPMAGLYLPVNDFRYLIHDGQASVLEQPEIFRAKAALLESCLREAPPPGHTEVLRRELAAWRTTWGHHLVRAGRFREASDQFRAAIRRDPTYFPAWVQWIKRLLHP